MLVPLRAAPIFTAADLLGGTLSATPPFGFNSQTFRRRTAGIVGVHQPNPGPFFTLPIQSSNDEWRFDVVQGTTEFAPLDAAGRPSRSGWHDHRSALSNRKAAE